jgi:hypothetical protein
MMCGTNNQDVQVRYRVRFPTKALALRSGHRAIVNLREGMILDLVGPAGQDPNLLSMECSGETVEISQSDFARNCVVIGQWLGRVVQ